ncbi:MAG: hypothetical protein ACXVPK_11885 [Tumebacillaceae bacterium]
MKNWMWALLILATAATLVGIFTVQNWAPRYRCPSRAGPWV